jgi:hypothetical protein
MTDSATRPIGDLLSYVQFFDAALAPDFCAQMISAFEQSAHLHAPNGRGHRAGVDNSSWVELNLTGLADPAFLGYFHAQIDKYLALYNASLPLTLPIPASAKLDDLRMKRYRAGAGDNFEPHFDAYAEKAARYLVLLWYLNGVAEGGETQFCDLHYSVAPRAGRLLIFPPFWMFQHAGLPPRSNDKYIVSTYLMF